MEQNRDRLYARPEEYQNLNRAIRENKEGEGELSKNLLLQMDPDDEFASFALGYRSKPSEDSSKFHPEIQVRYSNDQMLRIYKNLGKFEHPLSQLSVYGISSRDFHRIETMSLLTAEKADIMTEFLKEDIDLRRTKAQLSRHELARNLMLHTELESVDHHGFSPYVRSRSQRDNFFKHPQPF